MDTKKIYFNKKYNVHAIKWCGTNFTHVHAFLPNNTKIISISGKTSITLEQRGQIINVVLEDWIVLKQDRTLQIYKHVDFKNTFGELSSSR